MAELLGQLFAYTDVFDMQTRPELILLQKSMVIVEGVARDLDPYINMWTAAEPVAREWVDSNLSLIGRLREAGRGAETIGDVLLRTPGLLQKAEQAIRGLADMASAGVRLNDETQDKLLSRPGQSRGASIALWIAAVSLVAIALKVYGVL
jgi:ubiquinone biosynthesis protein